MRVQVFKSADGAVKRCGTDIGLAPDEGGCLVYTTSYLVHQAVAEALGQKPQRPRPDGVFLLKSRKSILLTAAKLRPLR